MSADNWVTCPRCLANAKKEKEDLIAKKNDCYGKIPEDKYLELVFEADKPIENEQTLREDYDIGIDGDEFSVNFRASCTKCGLIYKYSFNEQLKL